jgi:hypothetical protein
MMTASTYRQACLSRDIAFFGRTLLVLGFIAVGCFLIAATIPSTPQPEPLPMSWSDEQEPEEDPCVSPSQRRYFEERRALEDKL